MPNETIHEELNVIGFGRLPASSVEPEALGSHIGQVDSAGELYVDLFDDTLQVPRPSARKLLAAQLAQAEADLQSYALEVQDPAAREMYQQCAQEMNRVRQELEPYLR